MKTERWQRSVLGRKAIAGPEMVLCIIFGKIHLHIAKMDFNYFVRVCGCVRCECVELVDDDL